jgi:CO/xanthine dehydrogenase Mo-binding subunit
MTTNVAAPVVPGLLSTNEIRYEGREKVSGLAQYTADLTRPGMLWAAFVPSPHAHARIVAIDTAAALAMPGVHAALTGADIGPKFLGLVLGDWPVLAFDRVKFVGEYVAVVAAESREQAEAAAAAIEVNYAELPATFDTEAAIAEGAPLVHADDSVYTYTPAPRPPRPHPNMQGYQRVIKGDPDAAFAVADHVFERTFRTPRHHAGYLEPRATLVWIEGDVLHVTCGTQGPFNLRESLARTTGLPKEKVVIEPIYVGGAFGAKSLTIEEFPLYYLALATGRPVKYVRSHAEDIRSTGAIRHASTVRVRLALSKEGKLSALELRVVFDGGAFAAAKGVPGLLPGRCPKLPYAVDNAKVERMAVYTNTVPATFVRAPSDVQIYFALESLLDVAAAKLQIDPLELRMRNVAKPGDTDPEGTEIIQPRGREVLEKLREAFGWGRPPAPGRGRGISLTARHIAVGTTSLAATWHADGTVTIDTGACEPGVGQLTVIQRVFATELGIDPARITVKRGNTNDVPYDAGIGGSRGTLLLGKAIADAASKLRAERALKTQGDVQVIGTGTFMPKPGEPAWVNMAAYGVEASVDPDTGAPTLHDVVCVADVGAVINPIAHAGQIEGSFLMGLGLAMTEELVLDDGRIVNSALSDYKLPCQLDMPPFRIVCLESDGGPGIYGSKAAGEFNIAGVAPAIANAIADACGARVDTLTMTAERIYDALQRQ